MNFKAMNMKKGFIRLWIIGSVYWVLDPFDGYVFGMFLLSMSGVEMIIGFPMIFFGAILLLI